MARKKFTKLEQEIWDLVHNTGIQREELARTMYLILEKMRDA